MCQFHSDSDSANGLMGVNVYAQFTYLWIHMVQGTNCTICPTIVQIVPFAITEVVKSKKYN